MAGSLFIHVLNRIKDIEVEMFASPPKSMDDFNKRWAVHQELTSIAKLIEKDAKGIEDDQP